MNYKQVIRNCMVGLVIVAIPVSANFIRNDRGYFNGVENACLKNYHKNLKNDNFKNGILRMENSSVNYGCTWNPIMMRQIMRPPVSNNCLSFVNQNNYLPVSRECFLNNSPVIQISDRNCQILDNDVTCHTFVDSNVQEAAIPEPGIVLLMAAGLLSAGGLCLRKKK